MKSNFRLLLFWRDGSFCLLFACPFYASFNMFAQLDEAKKRKNSRRQKLEIKSNWSFGFFFTLIFPYSIFFYHVSIQTTACFGLGGHLGWWVGWLVLFFGGQQPDKVVALLINFDWVSKFYISIGVQGSPVQWAECSPCQTYRLKWTFGCADCCCCLMTLWFT